MLKSVMGVAAAAMLAAFTASGPASAADGQRQAQNRNPAVQQQAAGEEFSSQRRWRRYHRGWRYAYPRYRYRYWGPGPGAYYYGYPYAYRYYYPGPYVRFGPFAFGFY
jgi:hypothetical protein